MELALHIRNPDENYFKDNFLQQLGRFYNNDLNLNGHADLLSTCRRIYIGDEFCFHRLPTIGEIKKLCLFSKIHDSGVMFLTPPMTDLQLTKCESLFSHLEKDCPNAEVVANDWGVLFYLKRNYPGLQVSLGRLLNKGFKDPRLSDVDNQDQLSAAMQKVLDNCTFDDEAFLKYLSKLGVRRIEKDLMPYAKLFGADSLRINTSIYFPFGYITTGRICHIASQFEHGRKKFLITKKCAKFCNNQTMELFHESFKLRLFQNGNTIYYLYAPDALKNLLSISAARSLRLVYQGFAF